MSPILRMSSFDSLFLRDDPQCDSLTSVAIQVMSSNMLIVLERQASSQLPGDSDQTQESASNVPRSNVISERDMAILDNLLREKPSLGSTSAETMIMWLNNKPSKWLKSLPEEKQREVLAYAQDHAQKFKKIMKKRQQQGGESDIKKSGLIKGAA